MTGEVHTHAVEHHRSHRTSWLRAALLGANDGIVSTASLLIGVAAAGGERRAIVTAGIAGLVAGAISMATGEYLSVSSQRDAQRADLEIEAAALAEDPAAELRELAEIYQARGLRAELALEVATELSVHDDLGAHARDELGLTELAEAQPLLAAQSSALAFTTGAAVPIVATVLAPGGVLVPVTAAVAIVLLVVLGAVGARLGGASWQGPAARVALWSSGAMLVTYAIGRAIGVAV